LSCYNLNYLRDWSKIKEMRSDKVRAFQGGLGSRPEYGGYEI